MTLSTNVNAEKILQKSQERSIHGKVNINQLLERDHRDSDHKSGSGYSRANPAYDVEPIPKYRYTTIPN